MINYKIEEAVKGYDQGGQLQLIKLLRETTFNITLQISMIEVCFFSSQLK